MLPFHAHSSLSSKFVELNISPSNCRPPLQLNYSMIHPRCSSDEKGYPVLKFPLHLNCVFSVAFTGCVTHSVTAALPLATLPFLRPPRKPLTSSMPTVLSMADATANALASPPHICASLAIR